MFEVIRDETPVARKRYRCDASDYVLNYTNQGIFTITECRQIVTARRNKFQIQPGQKYIKQVQADGGEIVTFRAIPEMHELCRKYDLYPEY